MSRRLLEKTGFKDRQSRRTHERNQSMHGQAADRLTSLEDGLLAKATVHDVELDSATPINVEHRLGRAYVGCVIVRRDGAGFDVITEDPVGGAPVTKFIRVKASSGTHSVRLLVF